MHEYVVKILSRQLYLTQTQQQNIQKALVRFAQLCVLSHEKKAILFSSDASHNACDVTSNLHVKLF